MDLDALNGQQGLLIDVFGLTTSPTTSRVVSGVQTAIEKIAALYSADRAYIMVVDQSEKTVSTIHEFVRSGISPQFHTIQNTPLESFPWLMTQLGHTPAVVIDDVHQLGSEAQLERAELSRQEVRSAVLVGLICDDNLVGLFGLDYTERKRIRDDQVRLLELCGQALGAAVARVRAETEKAHALKSLQVFSGQFPGTLFKLNQTPDGYLRFTYLGDGNLPFFKYNDCALRHSAALMIEKILDADRESFENMLRHSAKFRTPVETRFRMGSSEQQCCWLEMRAAVSLLEDNSVEWSGILFDVTESKRDRRALEDQSRMTRTILENMPDGVITADINGRINNVNPAVESIFKISRLTLLGKSIGMLMPPGLAESQMYLLGRSLSSETSGSSIEILAMDGLGREFPVEVRMSLVDADQSAAVIGVISDISERKKAEAEIEDLAFYDPLTRLPNRRLLKDRLQQALSDSNRDNTSGALVFIDLDHFKTINDSAGHSVGDQLLTEVAKRLSQSVREGDTVARLGGDEFVVVLKGFKQNARPPAEQAEKVCEKMRDALNGTYLLNGAEYQGSSSMGVALFHDHDTTLEQLLAQADLAMFRAKDDGRNCIRFFDQKMQTAVSQRLSLEADLRQAIRHRQLTVYYQPQVDGDGTVIGAEALIRWNSPSRGFVSPGEFIPLAEDAGLIGEIGAYVLDQSLGILQAWANRGSGFEKLSLSVNVSAKQFQSPDFVSNLKNKIAVQAELAENLKLEITESVFALDLAHVSAMICEIRNMGVTVSLDDFGTGYSSLSYLKNLPLDELKIDQSFVRDLLDDPSDAAIAETILALASSLGMRALAEGVETAGQLRRLKAMGCQFFQGFLFARPMPATELDAYVAHQLGTGRRPLP
ncbi:MAG: PAS domain S-box/diguanylate cyclase (GGDEF) domain [Marinobacter excellens HL-55]|uniref:PAS domain S-box/diguanylate cyclase (GGDEF) domain n=1 Tax=Marinobacter excellens HL-55 TaxID=1305731 RepID=A0A0P7ZML9_9GAMM|nr:MAG: PAS domain S-box/diguanylate cyclase (GGDEF) domain [Marinobacter excellens HL-55]